MRPACPHRATGLVVYLLIVLLLPLAYLFFTGIYRTLQDLRAARQAIGRQQAFYLAEAAADLALARLRFEQERTLARQRGHLLDFERRRGDAPWWAEPDLALDAPVAVDLPTGRAEFSIALVSVDRQTMLTQRELRRIWAKGRAASGQTAQVTLELLVEGPLNGILAQGPILINGGYSERPFGGSLQTTLGTSAAITVTGGVNLQGPVRLAPPAGTEEPYTIFGHHPQPAYQQLVHTSSAGGVYLTTGPEIPGAGIFVRPVITGTVGVIPPRFPEPGKNPYPEEACAGAVDFTTPGATLDIGEDYENGRTGVIDLIPADHEITLCLQYFRTWAEGADNHPEVVFHAPTTLYLVGKDAEGFALRSRHLRAVDGQGALLSNGVRIIVTETPAALAGTVRIDSDPFGGSIIAPQSVIVIDRGMPQTQPWYFGGIVGREVIFWMAGRNVTFTDNPDSASADAAQPYLRVKTRLVGWRQES